LLDADTALFVVDSDVRGPMGLALVPAASQADAAVIVQRHGGKVLRRSEVTLDVLRQLKQRSAR
jgi:nitrous oxide reductase accessory protein NosL